MLTSGQLTEYVTIQRDTLSYPSGVETRTPATLAQCFADVRPIGGGEYEQNAQAASEVRYRVLVRYREDVRATDRVVWRGLNLEITDVALDRREWMTTLMCKVVNP